MNATSRVVFSPQYDDMIGSNYSSVCELVEYRNHVIRGDRSESFIEQNRVLASIVIVYAITTALIVFRYHHNEMFNNVNSNNNRSSINKKQKNRIVHQRSASSASGTGTIRRRKRAMTGKTNVSSGAFFFSEYRLLLFGLMLSVVAVLMSTSLFLRHVYSIPCGVMNSLYVIYPLLFTIPFVLKGLSILNSCNVQHKAKTMTIEQLARQKKKASNYNIIKKLKFILIDSLYPAASGAPTSEQPESTKSHTYDVEIEMSSSNANNNFYYGNNNGSNSKHGDIVVFDFANDYKTLFLLAVIIVLPGIIAVVCLSLTMPVIREGCYDCETYGEVLIGSAAAALGVTKYSFILLYRLKSENDSEFKMLRFTFYWVLIMVILLGVLFFVDPQSLDLHYKVSWEALFVISMVLAYTTLYVLPVFGIVIFCTFNSVGETRKKYRYIAGMMQTAWRNMGTRTTTDPESSAKALGLVFIKEEFFNNVLDDDELKDDFEKFVNETFLYELWRFRCEAIEWKSKFQESSEEERITKLLAIHEALIAVGSPFELNISDDLRDEFENTLIESNIIDENGNRVIDSFSNMHCPETILDPIVEEVTSMLLQNINSRFVGDVKSHRISRLASTRATTLTTQSTPIVTQRDGPKPRLTSLTDPSNSAITLKHVSSDFNIDI